jgi:hypothetical protein
MDPFTGVTSSSLFTDPSVFDDDEEEGAVGSGVCLLASSSSGSRYGRSILRVSSGRTIVEIMVDGREN